MFGYVLLVILVTAGVTLVESFLIAFVAGLLRIVRSRSLQGGLTLEPVMVDGVCWML